MAYDYRQAVLSDTEQMIRETKDYILDHFDAESLEDIDRDELESYITEKAQDDDGVTGNASGSYGFAETGVSAYRSAEALIGNDRLIAVAVAECDDNYKLGSDFELSEEDIDVLVRYNEVSKVVSEAIDNVIESPDKQVAESEPVVTDPNYEMYGYQLEVCQAIEDYIADNIDELLEGADINSVEDYEYSKNDIENIIYERVQNGEIELPYVSDREVMHHLNETLGNSRLDDYGYNYAVADYFSDRDVESIVKDTYAEDVAYGEIENALDNAYEKTIEPALEQREAEQEIEIDD